MQCFFILDIKYRFTRDESSLYKVLQSSNHVQGHLGCLVSYIFKAQ